MSHFIMLADCLRKFNNWNGFLAVVTGLIQYPVSRLKLTWKSLQPSIIKKWELVEKLASPMDNFKNLRELFDNTPPTILPISIFLKDLIFVEENHNWYKNKENETKLLNFHKVEILGKIITRLNVCQNTPYLFPTNTTVQAFLHNMRYLEYHVLEEQSKQIET
uniref:Ras-GEF domain-containing protein n=1 Tax=Arcella intermedia TaxID=1963864 RepID=A0A6B2LN20_9EUKA